MGVWCFFCARKVQIIRLLHRYSRTGAALFVFHGVVTQKREPFGSLFHIVTTISLRFPVSVIVCTAWLDGRSIFCAA